MRERIVGGAPGRSVAGLGSLTILVACFLVFGAPATPAATGAMKYIGAGPVPLPSRTTATATAMCPGSSSVVGGGPSIQGSNTATGMHSSFPIDGGDGNAIPDDGWRVVVNSRSAANKSIAVEAVCATAGNYRYVQRGALPVSKGGTTRYDVECTTGKLVGGGVRLSSASTVYGVTHSGPYDGDDADLSTDDGWRAAGANATGSTQSMGLFAICETSAAVHRYPTRVIEGVPTQSQTSAAARCPAGTEVTAGGGEAVLGSIGTELADSHSYDNGGGNTIPDDGWYGVFNNESGGPLDFNVYAVCRG